jgi:hypothetical protein
LIGQLFHTLLHDLFPLSLPPLQFALQVLQLFLKSLDFQLPCIMSQLELLLRDLRDLFHSRFAIRRIRGHLPKFGGQTQYLLFELVVLLGHFANARIGRWWRRNRRHAEDLLRVRMTPPLDVGRRSGSADGWTLSQ